jgi:hypothetical protein
MLDVAKTLCTCRDEADLTLNAQAAIGAIFAAEACRVFIVRGRDVLSYRLNLLSGANRGDASMRGSSGWVDGEDGMLVMSTRVGEGLVGHCAVEGTVIDVKRPRDDSRCGHDQTLLNVLES